MIGDRSLCFIVISCAIVYHVIITISLITIDILLRVVGFHVFMQHDILSEVLTTDVTLDVCLARVVDLEMPCKAILHGETLVTDVAYMRLLSRVG